MVESVHAAPKAEEKWVERKDCQLVDDRFADGDSFGLSWKDEKGEETERTYRLYGVDCPESDGEDKVLTKRIEEQAAHFKTDRATVLKFGKKAAEFTKDLLKKGKVRILTRGKFGQEVPKQKGRPQRRYALVEVTDDKGQALWLHELLLERGLARATGKAIAWPPSEERRHGEAAAETKFMENLGKIERRSRTAKAGIWASASASKSSGKRLSASRST